MPRHLDLVLPGLFERLTDWSGAYGDLGQYPALQTLLGKAEVSGGGHVGYENSLWYLLDDSFTADAELPFADLIHQDQAGITCRADPVHLRVDLSDLYLIEGQHLKISVDEYAQIESLIQQHVAEIGGSYRLDKSGQGYLSIKDAPPLISTPVSQVAGRGIDAHLPQGEGQRFWHGLLNELQMLLFSAPFNQQREAQGQTLVNGLWFWAGGAVADRIQPEYSTVCSDDDVSKSLLSAMGLNFRDAELDVQDGPNLLVNSRLLPSMQYDDVASWCEILAELDSGLFKPLLAQLRNGTLDSVMLVPCDGRRFSLPRSRLRRFWQRPRSLEHYAS